MNQLSLNWTSALYLLHLIIMYHINYSHGQIFQLTVGGVITETGRSAQQIVEEELRQEVEPVQTQPQQTGEPSVRETSPSLELVTRRVVR